MSISSTSLSEYLRVDETYPLTSRFTKQVQNHNLEAVEHISNTLVRIFQAKDESLVSKLLALRYYKDLFLSAEFGMLEKMNRKIDQYLIEVALYRKQTDSQDRGQTFFVEKEGRANSDEHMNMGKAYLTFVLEMIKSFAEWYPLDDAGKVSKQKKYYDDLVSHNVAFPQRNKYIDQSDRQKFLFNLQAKHGNNAYIQTNPWRPVHDKATVPVNPVSSAGRGSISDNYTNDQYSPAIAVNCKDDKKKQVIEDDQQQIRQLEAKVSQLQSQLAAIKEQKGRQIRQLQDQIQTLRNLIYQQQIGKPHQDWEDIGELKQQVAAQSNIIKEYQVRELYYKKQLEGSQSRIKDLEAKAKQLMDRNAQLELKIAFDLPENRFSQDTPTSRKFKFSDRKSESACRVKTSRSKNSTEASTNSSKTTQQNEIMPIIWAAKGSRTSRRASRLHVSEDTFSSKHQPFMKPNLLNSLSPLFRKSVLGSSKPFFQTSDFRLSLTKQQNIYRILCQNLQSKPLQISLTVLPNVVISMKQIKHSSPLSIPPKQRKFISSFRINLSSLPVTFLEAVVNTTSRYEVPLPITLLDFVVFEPLETPLYSQFQYLTTIDSRKLIGNSTQKNEMFLFYFQKYFQSGKSDATLRAKLLGKQDIHVMMRLEGDKSSRLISLVFESNDDSSRSFSKNLMSLLEFLFI